MKYALTLALVLALSVAAQAAPVATVNGITVDVTADTATPATGGLTAYIVSLQSPVGIYSADGRIDAVTGHMNQVWAFGGALPTPLQDTAAGSGWGFLSAAEKVNDSNIMIPSGSQVISRGVNEDMAGTYLANSATSTLALGFKNLANFNDVQFARVVLADGNTARFNFSISDSALAVGAFNFLIGAPVPEPMTLSLLGAGALALIRRRR